MWHLSYQQQQDPLGWPSAAWRGAGVKVFASNFIPYTHKSQVFRVRFRGKKFD